MGNWIRAQLRWVFFILHFGGGFLILWLLFKLARFSFYPSHNINFSLEAFMQTGYLVAGVIWGNLGWDAFKRITPDASPRRFVYILTRTFIPICVALPIFLVILSMFFQGHYLYWKSACTWYNGVLIGIAILVLLLQRLYRHSESGFFNELWGG